MQKLVGYAHEVVAVHTKKLVGNLHHDILNEVPLYSQSALLRPCTKTSYFVCGRLCSAPRILGHKLLGRKWKVS